MEIYVVSYFFVGMVGAFGQLRQFARTQQIALPKIEGETRHPVMRLKDAVVELTGTSEVAILAVWPSVQPSATIIDPYIPSQEK